MDQAHTSSSVFTAVVGEFTASEHKGGEIVCWSQALATSLAALPHSLLIQAVLASGR